MLKVTEYSGKNNTEDFSLPEYALKAKLPKGYLDWSYKPFFNLRLTEGKDRGKITDMDTELLNFSLTSPVEMLPQLSYDGSVNLIMNDKRNPPRLINSRFTVREKNTYERVDRLGENDTNLYDTDQFGLQTSLQKMYNKIPTVKFNGEGGSGTLKVGNYVFYFTYCDADGNETDIVAESSTVAIFKGQNAFPDNIEGGFRDEDSFKSVSFTLRDMDYEYSYVKVYYIRYSADMNEHRVLNAFKIDQKYPVKNDRCDILITGYEYAYEISEDQINTQYATIDSADTHVAVQNRLFLGNIEKTDPMYRDLQDISLRIYPHYYKVPSDKLIGKLDHRYQDYSTVMQNHEYYNSYNIYHYVGYAPNELYRFGIVYVMNNNSLSPVYNVRGMNGIPECSDISTEIDLDNTENKTYTKVDLYEDKGDDKVRKYIDQIDEATYEFVDTTCHENSKGVVRITDKDTMDVYGIRFRIQDEVLEYLKGKVKGFFFVRQKRIPVSLGQALTLPIERNTCLPMIPYGGKGLLEGFMDQDRIITHDYKQRLLEENRNDNNNVAALIFPEYELDQPYYNSLLTGGEFYVKEAYYNTDDTEDLKRDSLNERHYYVERLKQLSEPNEYKKAKLLQVADNVKSCGIDDFKFCARAGEAEEGFRYEKTGTDAEDKESHNYVRGSFGPYVGMTSPSFIQYGRIVDVYVPKYSESQFGNYFKIRYQDSQPYYSISERKNFDTRNMFEMPVYRGDSYLCNFTHRLNRNFQDSVAPLNDKIVDKNTWKDNFDAPNGFVKKENFDKINLGDINAVKLGSWITMKVRCSKNLSLRSNDSSLVDEMTLFNHPRTFYPYTSMDAGGSYKIPESAVYNDAYASTVGSKQYIQLPDVPYFKDIFQTRIYYSDIYINDAYVNGYRRFLESNYKDYETQYGGIVKLLPFDRDIICVFEHGIAKVVVNQQTAVGNNPEEPVFLNSSSVLPDNLVIISDTVGSQWKDSVIKTDSSIYGVDTHAKKIWRYSQQGLVSLTDHKLNQFLNSNITLTENETQVYVGVRDVKTHYNRAKGDVMFTYYDDLNGFEEKVWNLCYNEPLDKWITFYSWVPSFSVNLYNNYFSFDRDTSKYISKLGISWKDSNDSTGIVLGEPEVEGEKTKEDVEEKKKMPYYAELDGLELTLKGVEIPKMDGAIQVNYEFSLEKDVYGFYEDFKISGNKIELNYTKVENNDAENKKHKESVMADIRNKMYEFKMPVVLLNIQCQVQFKVDQKYSSLQEYLSSYEGYQTYNADLFKQTIALTAEDIYKVKTLDEMEKLKWLNLSTWFWSHGKTGLFDIKDTILPTNWYAKQHPFEFEFVVNDQIENHKIFDNLEIISNNAEPESFHYEITGDCYDFAVDKKNMYVRQEATKELYQYNGNDITFDPEWSELEVIHRLRAPYTVGSGYDRSTILPLYYARQDSLNTVEDYYHMKDDEPTKDFSQMAGGEIKRNPRHDGYTIWNHAKAVSITDGGRLRGNMHYKEDKWYVQINPLNIIQCNEGKWPTWPESNSAGQTITPREWIPVELRYALLKESWGEHSTIEIPNTTGYIYTVGWDKNKIVQREAKIKDKWLRVRIRYTGNKLAIIHSIQTLFSISYS